MSTCTIGRVWLNAVVLKTTYPGMGTKVQILYRALDSLKSHKLASILSDDTGYK